MKKILMMMNLSFLVFYNISIEILSKWILNLDKNKFWFSSLILMLQKRSQIVLYQNLIHQNTEEFQYYLIGN